MLLTIRAVVLIKCWLRDPDQMLTERSWPNVDWEILTKC
jgi:hypothetical protein